MCQILVCYFEDRLVDTWHGRIFEAADESETTHDLLSERKSPKTSPSSYPTVRGFPSPPSPSSLSFDPKSFSRPSPPHYPITIKYESGSPRFSCTWPVSYQVYTGSASCSGYEEDGSGQ